MAQGQVELSRASVVADPVLDGYTSWRARHERHRLVTRAESPLAKGLGRFRAALGDNPDAVTQGLIMQQESKSSFSERAIRKVLCELRHSCRTQCLRVVGRGVSLHLRLMTR